MVSKVFGRLLTTGLVLANSVSASTEAAHDDSLVASQVVTNPYEYDFPTLGATGASLFPMRLCNGFKLEEASIDAIQEQLGAGNLTSVELLQCYLERIHQTQPYLK